MPATTAARVVKVTTSSSSSRKVEPAHCPPKLAGARSEFCGAISGLAGYSVRSLSPEPPRANDCVIVTTIGFQAELERVQHIWDYVSGTLPRKREHCRRVRMLVFCKGFWAPECNVTFDGNVGLECLALLVVAGDERFRVMVQDALISIPANAVLDEGKRLRLDKVVKALGKPRLPPYVSFATRVHNDSMFVVDQWKGALEPARPRPLAAWARAHLPARTVELANNRTWDVEWSQGIFFAASQAVWLHPPQAYVRVANTLTGQRPECCHYLERLWRYLFGEF